MNHMRRNLIRTGLLGAAALSTGCNSKVPETTHKDTTFPNSIKDNQKNGYSDLSNSAEPIPANIVSQTWSKPFVAPQTIPSSAEVVIIGGGILGVSTAWFLTQQGVDVVLCEKGHIGGEQSSRNWGWVRQQGRDIREMPMMLESMKIWRGLSADIGEDIGFRETGCMYATKDEDDLNRWAANWLPIAKEYGLASRVIAGDELKHYAHGAAASWKGALYTPSDGCAEPHKAAPAIARAAERNGATILTTCAVRGLETEAGRVSGVITEYGVIAAPIVVCAAGVWASMFCNSLGLSIPQTIVRGTVVRTVPGESVLDSCIWEQNIGIRRRQDGGYSVANSASNDYSIDSDFMHESKTPAQWSLDSESPFEKIRVLNPNPNPDAISSIRESLETIFPGLGNIKFAEIWAGIVESTADAIPVIDQSEEIPGFYIAAGLSGHGFGIGPGAGKATAGMLTGKETGIDLSAFQLSRFREETTIKALDNLPKSASTS